MVQRRLLQTRAPAATIIIRLMVGTVFISEGLQKFLFPSVRGAGRFADVGFPAPHALATVVGSVELIAGVLIVVGLGTRLAAVVLGLDMLVAIISTKIPILLGHGYCVRYSFHSRQRQDLRVLPVYRIFQPPKSYPLSLSTTLILF